MKLRLCHPSIAVTALAILSCGRQEKIDTSTNESLSSEFKQSAHYALEVLGQANSGRPEFREQELRAIAEMKSHSRNHKEWRTAFDLELVESALTSPHKQKEDVDVVTRCFNGARLILEHRADPDSASQECEQAADARTKKLEEQYEKANRKH